MRFATQLTLITQYAIRAEIGAFRQLRRTQQVGIVVVAALAAAMVISLALHVASLVAAAGGTPVATQALTGAYVVVGIVLIIASLPFGLSALSAGSDVPVLLVTPLSARAIFTHKLLVAALWDGALALAILTPITIGIGAAISMAAPFYIAAAALLFITPLGPLAIGVGTVFALLRVASPRTVQTALGVLGALTGAIWLLSRLTPGGSILTGMAATGETLWWLPLAWPGEALGALINGDLTRFAAWAAAFAALSLGVFASAVLLTAAIAERGWLDVADGGAHRRTRTRAQVDPGIPTVGAGPIRAILVKDLRSVARNPEVWTRLVSPLAAFGVVVFLIARWATGLEGPWADTIRAATALGAVSFLCWNLNNRLALSAFNRDRRAIVWLLVSPASARQIVVGKLLVALAPQLVVLPLAAIGMAVVENLPPWHAATVMVGAPLLIVALAALTVHLATFFPKFDWKSAKRVNTAPAILAGTLGQYGLAALFIGILVVAPDALGGAWPIVALAATIAALITIGVVAVLLTDGARRVASWEITGS